MKNNSDNAKIILKAWLIIFVIFTVFKIINTFNKDILTNIFSIGTFPLEMTSMILFTYVYSKGEEKIAKIGITSIIVFFIMNLLYSFNIYSFVITDYSSIKDMLLSFIYYTSSACITLFNFFALFSLIRTNDERITRFKQVSIICILIFLIINLIRNLTGSTKIEFINNIGYSLNYIGVCLEYTVIILYLINKKDNNVQITNTPRQDNTQRVIQQQTQNQPTNNSNIEHL